jgi:glycosyltransferase involved in cell wall biosynthesis
VNEDSFTVIVPCYESAHLVGDALASIASQSRRADEVIVVDDGSSDDVASAVRRTSYEARVLRVEHGGLSAARNAGVAAAASTWVTFLDADDRYEPRFLEAIALRAAREPDLTAITTDVLFDTPEGVDGTFYGTNDFASRDQRSAILRGCFLTMLSAIRRDALLNVGGFDTSTEPSEDWDMWIRLVLAGGRLGFVDEPLARYRMHDEQITARRGRAFFGRVRVIEKTLADDRLTEEERARLREHRRHVRARALAAAAAEAGRPIAARQRWARLLLAPAVPSRHRVLGAIGVASPDLASRRADARLSLRLRSAVRES